MHSGVLKWVDNIKRGRARPKLTWGLGVSRLRETLRSGISPRNQLWIGALGDQQSMCLNRDLCFYSCLPLSLPSVFLFCVSLILVSFGFISSGLAQPNLLGTKGYVVVVCSIVMFGVDHVGVRHSLWLSCFCSSDDASTTQLLHLHNLMHA